MIKLNVLKKIHAESLTVFASLPDMGRVGGMVSSYLVKCLDAEHIADILSIEKPWVSYSDGLVTNVVDVYQIYYNEFYQFLILTGNSQTQDITELFKLCNVFFDYIESIGNIRCLYTAGGYLRDSLTESPIVCGAVNKPELKNILVNSEIKFLGNEVKSITWFNGLALGFAAERNIDAIGLFGEISKTNIPQPLAAKSIIKALSRIEGMNLDTKPLDKEYESILEDIKKQNKWSNFDQTF